MRRSLVLAVPLSLAVHAALMAGLLVLVPRPALPTLFVDLTLASPPGEPGPPTSRVNEQRSPARTSAPPSPRVRAPRSTPAAGPATAPPAATPMPERPDARAAEVSAATAEPPASGMPLPSNAAPPTSVDDSRPRMSAVTAAPSPGGPAVNSSSPGVSEGSRGGAGAAAAGESASVAAIPGAGRGEATTEARAGGGGGAGENPGAEYGTYLASLRRQVAESLRYPPVARRRGLTGTVYLEITIQANGAIGTASVVASSSHPLLDEAALETVRHLPPLPFPAELPPRRLRVRLPVIFRLE